MSKIKDNIIFVGLDYKKEISKLVIFNLIFIILLISLIFLKLPFYIYLLVGSGLVFFNYIYLSRYSSIKNKMKLDHDNELIYLLSYFRIFISNHYTVYGAIKALLPYSSEWMKEELTRLINDIDKDKSNAPFVNFASKFNSLLIPNIFLSIYQMVDNGENNDATSHFYYLFDEANRALQVEEIENKKKSMESLNTFPLVGAGYIAILLTLSVVSIIGELINVI